MVLWRIEYAVTVAGSPAALAAARTGFFHESLSHGLASPLANNGAAGNLSLAISAKNAAVSFGKVMRRSPPALSLPIVRTPSFFSKLADCQGGQRSRPQRQKSEASEEQGYVAAGPCDERGTLPAIQVGVPPPVGVLDPPQG